MPTARSAAGVITTLAQPAPFDAERLRHDQHQRVPLGSADHRKADAGVAAGRLEDSLAGLQRPGFLCCLNYAEGKAILHRPERIEGLDLDVQVYTRRSKPVDTHDGRVADRFEDAQVTPRHSVPPIRGKDLKCNKTSWIGG